MVCALCFLLAKKYSSELKSLCYNILVKAERSRDFLRFVYGDKGILMALGFNYRVPCTSLFEFPG